MKNWINLNVHSYYSFLQSTVSIKNIIDFAINHEQEYACLVDENVMYGAMEFYDACKLNHLKPIVGLQIEYQKSLLVIIAKNYEGYQALLKISSLVMLKDQLDLTDFLSDNIYVIRLTGDFNWASKNFFVNDQSSSNRIACHEVRIKKPEDAILLSVINAIDQETKLCADELHQVNHDLCFWTKEQMAEHYDSIALDNLDKLVTSCDLEIIKNNTKNILRYPWTEGLSSADYLRKLVFNHLDQYLTFHPELNKDEYINRANHELEVINQKGFDDYFLIVQDFINWAKSQKIVVGPGRGSAAGSLVSFCLNITEIDPLQYDLLFERFLNKDRESMPDIDTDIMDSRRDEVIDYLFKKYGDDHVAHIITFSRMKAKMAIRDVGRVLNVDSNLVDKICKNLPLECDYQLVNNLSKSNLLMEEYQQNPILFHLSDALIGLPRQFGTHAAGMVLSNSVLTDALPIQAGLNDRSMCQYSMEYLEDLGLIKMDLLGLRNLTILDNILKLVKYVRGIDIDLQKLPLNDEATFKMLSEGKTNGIFQLESDGMRKILKRMHPQNIEDISLVSAMYRPGALQNINLYLERRKKNEQPPYLNEAIKKVLYPTYGVIIYQEQIIQLVQIVAKFNGAKSDTFRRAISKKKESVILEMKKEFIEAAMNNGYSEKDALGIFEYMESFANYGFNHSHSLSYSYISYWLAYLKCHYPLETISVLLSFGDSSKEKVLSYIKESISLGIKILPPDINLSNLNFVLNGNQIIFSLVSINGVGIENAKKMIAIRNAQDNHKFTDALKAIAILSNNGISTKMLELLIKVGAFDYLEPRRNYLLTNLPVLTNKKMNLLDQNNNFIFDLDLKTNVTENPEEYAQWELKLLGMSFVVSKWQKIYDELESAYQLVHLNEVTSKDKCNVLLQIDKLVLSQSTSNKTILKLTVMENNEKYLLYAFSDAKTLYSQMVEAKYCIVNLKPYKDTYTIQHLVKVIKE